MNFQKALKLSYLLPGMDGLCGNAFGAVDTAAAAQSHDGLAAVLLVSFVTGFHIVGGGIGVGVGLQGVADTALLESVQHGLYLSTAHHTGTGDHQNVIDSLFLQEGTQFLDFTGSFQIFGHSIAHEIVADFQNTLKGTAPENFQFIRHFHNDPPLSAGYRGHQHHGIAVIQFASFSGILPVNENDAAG